MPDVPGNKGSNSVFAPINQGDSAAKVLSASRNNQIAGAIERLSQWTFGAGADALVTGPMVFRKPRNGGSSATIDLVLFELETVDCENGTATATVLNYICDGEDNVGDTIDLVDDMGCYLVGPPELLVGVKGKAVKMAGAYDCEWTILSLCCGGFTC